MSILVMSQSLSFSTGLIIPNLKQVGTNECFSIAVKSLCCFYILLFLCFCTLLPSGVIKIDWLPTFRFALGPAATLRPVFFLNDRCPVVRFRLSPRSIPPAMSQVPNASCWASEESTRMWRYVVSNGYSYSASVIMAIRCGLASLSLQCLKTTNWLLYAASTCVLRHTASSSITLKLLSANLLLSCPWWVITMVSIGYLRSVQQWNDDNPLIASGSRISRNISIRRVGTSPQFCSYCNEWSVLAL